MASSRIDSLSEPTSHGSLAAQSCGRKPAFLRWLRKLFKGRSNRQKLPQLHGEETIARHVPGEPMDDQSKAKNGESDHAVALSLAEDLKDPHGCRRRTEHDEDLARALQEKLNEPSYPSYDPTSLFPGEYRLCGGCNGDLGYGDYLLCMGAFWHPSCFRCYACDYQIVEHEFSLSGRNPYHMSCFRELHHPSCEVCHQFIPPNDAGLIEFRSHPFWGQKYCPIHEHDNTARCCSCERLEGHLQMPETRGLCLSEEQTVTSV
ncbi:protein DA1-related 2-like isoform X2 [Papaver somniferum]|uniref:protein DA1-related 2-like isoform X2 n=1 Tax=Papaver somniferum TaxID=3469 RepID=UPI000E6F8EA4|nr:protein DA1-related 2-like isoform X2 [Papaver somniferum]